VKQASHLRTAAGYLIVGLLLCLASACTIQNESTANAAAKDQKSSKRFVARSFTATLTRVIDGDSLVVQDRSGKKHKLRLAGIDAPEGRQTGGPAATEALRKFLGQGKVRVSSSKTDRYKRLIAHVRAGNQDVSLLMITAGMAWFYRRYERELPLARRQTYDLAEKSARSQRRGLWAAAKPIPPWQFRRRQRRR